MPSPLLLTSFQKVLASLDEALAQPKTIFMRDATIQRFEYTFEIAIKMMKRFLEQGHEGTSIDELSYRDLCRAAGEAGLLDNPARWWTYREARNSTSHAYEEGIAEDVYATAGRFAVDARRLLGALMKRV